MASIHDDSVIKMYDGNYSSVPRYIGIEIETVRDFNHEAPAGFEDQWSENSDPFNRIGNQWSDADTENYDDYYGEDEDQDVAKAYAEKIKDLLGQDLIAMVGLDGGDIEVATQPLNPLALSTNDPKINKMFSILNKYFRTSQASGTHIHVSRTDDDNKNMYKNLYWFSIVYAKQLYNIFRRKSGWALSPIDISDSLRTSNEIRFDNNIVQGTYDYGNKSMIIIKRPHTYECRGGSASTDPREIKAWALMFKQIVETCNQDSIIGLRFEDFMPTNTDARQFLRSRTSTTEWRQICPLKIYKETN